MNAFVIIIITVFNLIVIEVYTFNSTIFDNTKSYDLSFENFSFFKTDVTSTYVQLEAQKGVLMDKNFYLKNMSFMRKNPESGIIEKVKSDEIASADNIFSLTGSVKYEKEDFSIHTQNLTFDTLNNIISGDSFTSYFLDNSIKGSFFRYDLEKGDLSAKRVDISLDDKLLMD